MDENIIFLWLKAWVKACFWQMTLWGFFGENLIYFLQWKLVPRILIFEEFFLSILIEIYGMFLFIEMWWLWSCELKFLTKNFD